MPSDVQEDDNVGSNDCFDIPSVEGLSWSPAGTVSSDPGLSTAAALTLSDTTLSASFKSVSFGLWAGAAVKTYKTFAGFAK